MRKETIHLADRAALFETVHEGDEILMAIADERFQAIEISRFAKADAPAQLIPAGGQQEIEGGSLPVLGGDALS